MQTRHNSVTFLLLKGIFWVLSISSEMSCSKDFYYINYKSTDLSNLSHV